MVNEAESTAEKDDKAEKAAKKVAKDIEYDEGHKGKDDNRAEKAGEKVKKDIEYDDKKDKKKSLKDWFEIIDKNLLNEAEQVTMEPAKQNTQVIKQGTKVLGTVTNPQLAAQIKQSIGKGEMSLAGHEMKEEAEDNPESAMLEKWAGDAEVKPTGQYAGKSVEELKSMLNKLKKSGPHKEGSPGFKKMRQVMFAIRAKKGWEGGVDEAKAKNPYAIGMAQAMKSAGDKPPLKKSTITKAHDIAKSIKKKTDEAEIPNSGPDYGAGLGAGRKDNVLEAKPDFLDLDKDGNKKESMKKAAADKKKKKVDESMDKCKAAYHEGKSHGLSKHSYASRYDHGSPEHEHYHKGFKEGLDECYGLMPVQGLVVGEGDMPAATVPGMAHQAMPAKEGWKGSAAGAGLGAMLGGPLGAAAGAVVGDKVGDEMDEGNAFTAALAKTPKGGKFSVGGKTFTDNSNYSAKVDEYAFESLDKQLNDLLNEGLSVNMSQGLNGPSGDLEDTVSVTATSDDASKLLDFIKQVGLGGLGGEKAEVVGADEPAIAVMSDYGAPKFSGHDGMADLLAKVSGGKEGHDHAKEETCNECGMMEADCGCDEGKEMVDEVESEDQMEYQVAEDDGEGYTASQADAGNIDAALAMSGTSKGGATNEDGAEAPGSNPVGQAEQEEAEEVNEESQAEKDDHAERAAKKVAKDIEYDEGHKGKDDDKAEKAGKEVKKDIEYDDKKDKKLDEWANDAGKKGTDASFERDIEFMTKVISGGLNKPKSTGQTTIPVIAGQTDRMGVSEDVIAEWKKLSGIK